jgi:hypothetical protein
VSRTSFQKRQKEMKRQEKQQKKAERRVQRKLAKNAEDGGAGQHGEGSAPVEQEPTDAAAVTEVSDHN